MKKKILLSSLLVACLAFPTITLFSGCQQNGLSVNENTSLSTLKNALKKQNYSVMVENIDNNQQTYNRTVTYVTPNIVHEIHETTVNNEKTTLETFEFAIGDENYYVTSCYNATETNKYKTENLYTQKNLVEYKNNYDYVDWGNFDYLTTKNNKLVLKSYTDAPFITLNFISGKIITQEVKNNVTQRITLFDIGNTKIDLPKQITIASINSDWANYVYYKNIKYEKQNDAYVAVIESGAVPENYVYNIEPTINNKKVSKIIVEDQSSFDNAVIKVMFNSDNSNAYGTGTYAKEFENLGNVEYDFSNFVAKGGSVLFQDITLAKTNLTNTTKFSDLNTYLAKRNFALEQTVTEVDALGEKTVKHYSVKYDGLMISEIETITTSAGKTINENYVLALDNKLYKIHYQNGSMQSYQQLPNGFATSTIVNDFINTLSADENEYIAISSATKQLNPYTSINFNNGNLQTVLFNEENNINTAIETELQNIGCTNAEIPQYAIDKIAEQEGISLD